MRGREGEGGRERGGVGKAREEGRGKREGALTYNEGGGGMEGGRGGDDEVK